MIEASITLTFDPRHWTIGAAYPEYDGGKGGIPCIGFIVQFFFISIQTTLYKTWKYSEKE